MMEGFRQWLLAITAAAILVSLAEALMPEGGVKQVGRLVCGLMLMGAVLTPFGNVSVMNFSLPEGYDVRQELREEAAERMRADIEGRFAAYSMDKAEELGVQARIRVLCREDNMPERVQITLPPGTDGSALRSVLAEDFGLEPEAVELREEGT